MSELIPVLISGKIAVLIFITLKFFLTLRSWKKSERISYYENDEPITNKDSDKRVCVDDGWGNGGRYGGGGSGMGDGAIIVVKGKPVAKSRRKF